MQLVPDAAESKSRDYRYRESVYAVERDHVEVLPGPFESGEDG